MALWLYRISSRLYRWRIPELPYMIQYINAIMNGCEIHYKASIGSGFKISHSRGVVIGNQARLGSNVTIHSGVVIGKNGKNAGMPKIGNNVFIGANAVIIGPIEIGDKTVIGANAMVNKSFPGNTMVGGVPARTIKILDEDV